MRSMQKRKRTVPTIAIIAIVLTTAMLSSTSSSTSVVLAFVAVSEYNTPSFSSISRHVKIPTTLLHAATNDNDASDQEVKLTIAKITDEDVNVHLNPPGDRPVLLDLYAPHCGPCKLLDKVIKKAHANYHNKIDFIKWNVADKENTAEVKKMVFEEAAAIGYKLTKLPSLILFRNGKPVAVREGMANEFQLDFWLENELPDVLEKTFDENGVKMIPMPKKIVEEEPESLVPSKLQAAVEEAVAKSILEAQLQQDRDTNCTDPEECWEKNMWENRDVVPAMDFLPSRPRSKALDFLPTRQQRIKALAMKKL